MDRRTMFPTATSEASMKKIILLGSLDDARDEGLDTLVRHEDDTLPGDNSPEPGHDTLVKAAGALGLDDLRRATVKNEIKRRREERIESDNMCRRSSFFAPA